MKHLNFIIILIFTVCVGPAATALNNVMSRARAFRVLDVPATATQAQITKAYRRLARRYHPDMNKDADAEAIFKQIGEAYSVLHEKKSEALRKEEEQAQDSTAAAESGSDRTDTMSAEEAEIAARAADSIKNSFDPNDVTFDDLWKAVKAAKNYEQLINAKAEALKYASSGWEFSVVFTYRPPISKIGTYSRTGAAFITDAREDQKIKLRMADLLTKNLWRFWSLAPAGEDIAPVVSVCHPTIANTVYKLFLGGASSPERFFEILNNDFDMPMYESIKNEVLAEIQSQLPHFMSMHPSSEQVQALKTILSDGFAHEKYRSQLTSCRQILSREN